MSESELQSTIDSHIQVLREIDQKNQQKAEAVENEEFDVAAALKKQINELKNRLLSPKQVQDLLKRVPELTMKQLLELMLDIDSNLHFSKNLLTMIDENKA